MATGLGGIAIYLGLDSAQFTRGLTDAEVQAQRKSNAIAAQFGLIAGGAAAVGAALVTAAAGIPKYFNDIVAGAAALDDFSERTGISVEQASRLDQIMRISGRSITELQSPLDKLAKGLVNADDETKGVGLALKTLGVETRTATGDLVGTSAILENVAKALAGYENGAGKSALAQAVFGKSGAELIPILNDIADAGDVVSNVTAEQAAQAEAYEKQANRLGLALENQIRGKMLEALPAVSAFKQTLLEVALQTLGLQSAADSLTTGTDVGNWARDVGQAVATYIIGPIDAAIRVIKVVGITLAEIAAKGTAILKGEFASLQVITAAAKEDIDRVLLAPTAGDRFAANFEKISNGFKNTAAASKVLDPSLFSKFQKGLEDTESKAGKAAKAQVKAFNDVEAAAKKAATEAARQQEQLNNLLGKISGKETGTDSDFIENLMLLKSGLDSGRLSIEQYTQATEAYINQQKYMTDATKLANEEIDAQIAATKKGIEEFNRAAEETANGKMQALNMQADALVDRLTDIGTNGSAAVKRLGEDIQRYLLKTLLELTVKKWFIDIGTKSSGSGASGGGFWESVLGAVSGFLSGASGGGATAGGTGTAYPAMSSVGTAAVAPTVSKSSVTNVYNVGSQVSRGEVLTGLMQARTAAVNDVQNGMARNAPGFRG
ncbi:MAG: hypothetical protein ACRCVX_13210 [Shewanella sp.]